MRKFGLIGGTSWMSTLDYYRALNLDTNQRFENNTNPPIYIVNLNQRAIHDLQQRDDWDAIAAILAEKCRELESIGCEGLALCANTPHMVFDAVQKKLSADLIHIGASVGRHAHTKGYQKVGLLGTRFTMTRDFIKKRISDDFNIDVIVPDPAAQDRIQSFLYEEMSRGIFSSHAQEYFASLIDMFKDSGAEAAVLGCTEFPILLRDVETSLPKIDSTQCHVEDITSFIHA